MTEAVHRVAVVRTKIVSLRRMWTRRRRLRATGAGRALIAMTFAVGLAAFNTGNNLLFFGWGLLLGTIVISGILSESTLQAVMVEPGRSSALRARLPGRVPLLVTNRRRVPAFAVAFHAVLSDVAGQRTSALREAARSFELRVPPGSRRDVELHIVPSRRGRLRIAAVRVATAFPFGFFEKEKRVELDPPMDVVVFPARVDVAHIAGRLLAKLGESPARRAGPGDELFSLRDFRAGDDLRRVAWRRTARTGRLVVRETEAARSQDVMICLPWSSVTTAQAFDHAVNVAATLAEDLLVAGHAVGLVAPQVTREAARGARQRAALLTELALLEPHGTAPLPLWTGRGALVAVVAEGVEPPRHAHIVVYAAQCGDGLEEHLQREPVDAGMPVTTERP